ncbi:MAG: hypothetical protein GY862_01980 [Gammaproteobacteria bacterium]|nr:hypothetical protein [Gammaproteobacteria bacterium]
MVICPKITLTLLSGTQSSGTVSVRVQGCVTPATGGVNVLLAVLGSQAAATAGTGSQQPEGFFEQALTAAGDLLVGDAVAADCTEITGSATTDAGGDFSADFDIPCGPGIRSVSAEARLSGSRAGEARGYGILSVPGETTQNPVAPTKPISPCSVGIFNRSYEDLTLIQDGTEYILESRNDKILELTVYEEPFSLTFRGSTNSKKILAYKDTQIPFTEEITIEDAVCGGRYTIYAS